MLDVYTSITRKNNLSGVYDIKKPKKIIFSHEDIGECYKYILEHEPDNKAIQRQLELYNRD